MLPERLKSLRLEAKLTQKEISEKLEIAQGTYAKYEKGRMKPKNIQKIADFFDVSTDYLLGDTDNRDYLNETDLEKALDGFKSFDGKTMDDHDRELIREFLIETFNNK